MLEGSVYPVTWSTDADVFGAVEGFATTYFTPVQPGWVTVALRVGGRQAWGDFPYFEAAYLGASESLRGYPRNRFAGDAAVFGNAELRLRLARTKIILPGEFGVFGLADAGRVWFEGDDNDDWHTDFGGGIFFGFRDRMFAFSAGLAKGDEKQRFYLGVGLGY
jgi:hemolysin activation/secretion protein